MHADTPNGRASLTWRPLLIFAGYRLVVALLLLAGLVVGGPTGVLSVLLPARYAVIALTYVLFSLVLLVTARRRRPPFLVQVTGGVIGDIAAIGLLTYTLGSQETALGVLLVTAVAGGSLLAGLRLGAFFAALGTVALFTVQTLAVLEDRADAGGYTQVALLGLAIFAVSITAALLARRARESEALAEERGLDVANLEALNAHIVQRLDTGVIALDRDGRIRLANRLANRIIGAVEATETPALAERAPALDGARRQLGDDGGTGPSITAGGEEFLPRFVPVGERERGGTLIFLENLTAMRAQVQQAKLASMGRLTASIAHEIRNPLGAMMQAAQLLGEADNLKPADQRLVGIITKQGRRLNETVENVLQLSRRSPANREVVELAEWVTRLVDEWRPEFPDADVELATEPARALFDRSHLHQVVDNLLRNAVVHGSEPTRIRVQTGHDRNGAPYLEVRDQGPGIDPEIRAHLFEPFATSRRGGTGLGLYLARELCEASQARIALLDSERGARFRITFAAPDRSQGGTQ
ncbi:ATP-binding protein [Arhodomonas sp. SL1]|uniref:sensor histidine kinase n=1 Tax=Arhodomonas sp. SL1 TaxID=3425691 RepID=UPI003F881E03